jgi:hypothetical protein
MMIRDNTVNTTTCTERENTMIDVRDQTGKLFAKMTQDGKRLQIMKRDKYVEIFVNKYGRMQVINK